MRTLYEATFGEVYPGALAESADAAGTAFSAGPRIDTAFSAGPRIKPAFSAGPRIKPSALAAAPKKLAAQRLSAN
jgi:hypothetical protein